MTDLGCSFLTEQCTSQSVFPYLCNTTETQLVCTYDHLTKVCMHVARSINIKTIIIQQPDFNIIYNRAIALLGGEALMVVLLQLLLMSNVTVELK